MDNFTRLGKSGVVLVRHQSWLTNALYGKRCGRQKLLHPVVCLKFVLVGAAAKFEPAIQMFHDLRVTEGGDKLDATSLHAGGKMIIHASDCSGRGRTSTGVGAENKWNENAHKNQRNYGGVFYAYFMHFDVLGIVK